MEAVSWIAVAMSGIAMVGNVAQTISNNITKRQMEANQLSHDEATAGLRTALAACQSQHAESEADRANMRGRLEASEKERADIREQLAAIRGRLSAQEKQGA